MRKTITLMLFAALIAGAQQIGQNANTDNSAPTFTAGTQLVVESVVVTDKKGTAVEGLTARDFTVTEDGVAQSIKFFEFQHFPEHMTPMALYSRRENVHIYDKLGLTKIAPESAGTTRYKDRRLLALYFDMTAMPPNDQLRALEAAQKFVRAEMNPADLMAILRYQGGAVQVLQDFTANHDRLLSILGTMSVGEGQGFDESTSDSSTPDTGAAFGQDDSEFNIFNTDRQLSALQTAATMLGQLNEKKLLIYFASGMRLNGLNNQAQLHATVNAAVRAGVSFWPIDARGLVASAPLGDATQGLRLAALECIREPRPWLSRPTFNNSRTRSTRWLPIREEKRFSIITTWQRAFRRRSNPFLVFTSSDITARTRCRTASSGGLRSRSIRSWRRSSITGKGISPAKYSTSLRRPIKSGNWKMR